MTLFSEVLGVDYEDEITVKSLAADKSDQVNIGSPLTVPSTDDTTRENEKEVEFLKELELTYRNEPQVFRSINLNTQMIMGAGYEMFCDNDPTGKVLKFFKAFMENIGRVGEQSTEEEILEAIFKNQMKFGKFMLEEVFNKTETRIVDLALTDPVSMDFARNESGSIVLDNQGRVVGFTQNLGFNTETENKGDPVPENVYLKNKQIFLKPKRIANFWLYGDKLNPIGLIEPGYKSIIRKQNIQEAQTNSIYARGTFPIIDYVGSPERFPTPKMIANATNKLKMMQHNRYFAFPYWHNVKPLEIKQSDIVEKTVKDMREEAAASLGMPLAFSMGTGEATNRSTLNTQQKTLEFSLNDVVKKTLALFKKQVFRRISFLMNFRDKNKKLIVPHYVWGDIGAEDKDAKASRLTNYLKNGGITPEYVMPYVIKSEKLTLDPTIKISRTEKESTDKNKKKERNQKKELGKHKTSNFTYNEVNEVLRRL